MPTFSLMVLVRHSSHLAIMPGMLLSQWFTMCLLLGGVLVGAISAADGVDPLTLLPQLPRVMPRAASAPWTATNSVELVKGVRVIHGSALFLDGSIILDQGPRDGLEVLACLGDGKTHEAYIRLAVTQGELVKAAALLVVPVGITSQIASENSGIPARGLPMRVQVHWRDDAGAWQVIDASCLVRDRISDRPYPALPYIYTGSHEKVMPKVGANGETSQHIVLMLNNSKSVVVNFDEPDALLASPFPGARTDNRFEVASFASPSPGTAVTMSIANTTLPLTVFSDDLGQLRPTATAAAMAALDDAGLEALLTRHYRVAANPTLRAVAVQVPMITADDVVVAIRERLLAAAARAKVWVIPVFTQPLAVTEPSDKP